jgi:hypothetical protein
MPTTTTHKRGAVVLLPFPFSDQSSSKIQMKSLERVIILQYLLSDELRLGQVPLAIHLHLS